MISSRILAATVAGGVVGAGALMATPSLAASGDSTPTPSPAPSATSSSAHADRGQHAQGHRGHGLVRSRHLAHAQWTTADGKDHRAIRGSVTAVSASSVTVRAKDGVSQTYTVTEDTKVRVRDGQKGLDSIGEVEVGDRALVVGTGPHDAVRLHAGAPKKTSPGD